MTKKIILRLLTILGVFAIEVAVAVGLFILMVIIIFGLMSGCTTAQEFIHIFF